MSRYKKFIETDVYTEAKKRINHIFDIFDTVCVSFSGGKDSLVCMHLVKEVMDERGIKKPLITFFRDEEFINPSVLEFVNEYRQLEWVDLRWFCIPLKSNKYVLGESEQYIQWDQNRQHSRQEPEWAIKLPEGDKRVFDQLTTDEFMCKDIKGKIGLITGVRAEESIFRYRSVVNKLNENYICASEGSARIKLCKPIYDWSEDDIFKYLYDKKIRYCPVYNSELYAGRNLRVSTPLHAESAKKFNVLRTLDPDLYEQSVKAFPEMILQERYAQEYAPKDDSSYEWVKTFDDAYKYAKAIKNDGMRKAVIKILMAIKNNPCIDRNDFYKVFKNIMRSGGKRMPTVCLGNAKK